MTFLLFSINSVCLILKDSFFSLHELVHCFWPEIKNEIVKFAIERFNVFIYEWLSLAHVKWKTRLFLGFYVVAIIW